MDVIKVCKEIRKDIINMVYSGKGGHIGSALSMVEILYTLYFNVMKVNPKNIQDINRDRLVLSSGQGALALYVIMQRRGFFPRKFLGNFLKKDFPLTTFPCAKKLHGVEMTVGSLGHGLSFAIGLALYAKKYNLNYQSFVIVGDGELNEGSIWEAALSAAHYNLDNIILIINRNMVQIDGTTEEVMNIEPLDKKWRSFGWTVFNADGHNVTDINNTIKKSFSFSKPKVIIANTIKGKGISFMENNFDWHFKIPTDVELQNAMSQLN